MTSAYMLYIHSCLKKVECRLFLKETILMKTKQINED